MSSQINKLSPRDVATKKKPGRYADGGNLYLQISRQGTKAWLFRYMLDGRARQMGLGSVNTRSLAEARSEARRCRQLLLEGIDPIEERKQRLASRRSKQSLITFEECAEKFIRSQEAGWNNIKHGKQWRSTLENYVYPIFGKKPVQDIETQDILAVLEPIWFEKTETATRVRGRIEAILDSATVQKYRQGENPARWKGHLDKLLPSKSKIQAVTHLNAMPWQDVPPMMKQLGRQEGIAALGLRFLILTATRTGEVLLATWDEIDEAESVWIIPGKRMKAGKEHRIPLSKHAVTILKEARKHSTSDYIFPGQRKNRPLSNMAFLQLLKRMKRLDVTVHGFRSSFRDWVAETTPYPNEVAEMALAHAVSSQVEAAYRRGDLLEKRRQMMEDWANFCME
ncbi:MAG: tyrosine-type recombinase/integrase [Alphaproteobacteria bacterium]